MSAISCKLLSNVLNKLFIRCSVGSLMHILESTRLKQHVQGPTHYKGHTLDILLSRDKSDILCNVQVTDIGLSDDDGNLTCDHYAASDV